MFQKNISLKPFNTFGIDVLAENFAEIDSVRSLKKIIAVHKDLFVLSGGSNILLTRNIKKPVIFINTKGIEVLKESNNTVYVKAQAGENWHGFVCWCISKNFGGLENLSLIPGNVGTSPMQNIGAYGVEIKDTFESLEAMEISSGKIRRFNAADCSFGYRESVFKNELRNQFIILNVTFRLTRTQHTIQDSYGAIRDQLKKLGVQHPGIRDISEAVIAIRQSKLPDPNEIGNSGSFFKNPVISKNSFLDLLSIYPDAPHYQVSEELVKVPAGWLVEACGFKGKRFGDAGVHEKQALVLVNYKDATGQEILNLATEIQKAVLDKFDIELDMEVNII